MALGDGIDADAADLGALRTDFDANRFVLSADGLLLYWPDAPSRHAPPADAAALRVVVPAGARREVLNAAHSGLFGAHVNGDALAERLRARFWWPSLAADARAHAKTCVPCQWARRSHQPRYFATAHHDDVPLSSWHVDFVEFGHAAPTARGNRFAFTAVDEASGYAVVVPVADNSTLTALDAFLHEVVARFGVPRRLVSDRGEFAAKLARNVAARLGCELTHTTAYNPRANAIVERFHRSLKELLAKLDPTPDKARWDLMAPWAVLALNGASSSTRGASPFRMLYGRELRVPLDARLEFEPLADDAPALDVRANALVAPAAEALRAHRELREKRAAEEYADAADERQQRAPRAPTFSVGQEVLLFYQNADRGASKLARMVNRSGPWIVREVRPSGMSVRLESRNGTVLKNPVSVRRLRPYLDPTSRDPDANALVFADAADKFDPTREPGVAFADPEGFLGSAMAPELGLSLANNTLRRRETRRQRKRVEAEEQAAARAAARAEAESQRQQRAADKAAAAAARQAEADSRRQQREAEKAERAEQRRERAAAEQCAADAAAAKREREAAQAAMERQRRDAAAAEEERQQALRALRAGRMPARPPPPPAAADVDCITGERKIAGGTPCFTVRLRDGSSVDVIDTSTLGDALTEWRRLERERRRTERGRSTR